MDTCVTAGSDRKFASAPSKGECPKCRQIPSPREAVVAPKGLFRPLQPLVGRAAVKEYVSSLGAEAREWLLALYLDKDSRLIAFETVARGGSSSCPVPIWHLINCAKALEAAGFILIHNHPGGRPQPTMVDVRTTQRVAQLARECNLQLFNHFIIAGDELYDHLHQVCSW